MLDSILNFVGKGIDAWSSSNNADKNNATQLQIAKDNIENQRLFAQQGIRWKVADAQAAGLHPLAALGAQTSSFAPVSVGDLQSGKTDFGGMGQDIGRAIDAGSTQGERQDRMGAAIARTAQVFSLEKMNLENELLKSQVAKSNATLPPPIPSNSPVSDLPGNWQNMVLGGPTRTNDGHAVTQEEIKQKAQDIPATARYSFMGIPLNSNPRASDAQTIEDRLGDSEILATITAMGNLLADLGYTYWPDRARASGPSAHERRWQRRN